MLNFVLTGNYGGADIILANPQFVRSGSAHSMLLNPTNRLGSLQLCRERHAAGGVFVLYGTDLATKIAQRPPFRFRHAGDHDVTVNGRKCVVLCLSGPDQCGNAWIFRRHTASVVSKTDRDEQRRAVWVPARGRRESPSTAAIARS